MTPKNIIIAVALIILLLSGILLWDYMAHFRLADTGVRYERPLYFGNNTLHYYYLSRTHPTSDDIIRMCIEERGSTDYGIDYSWKRPAARATTTYAAYLSSPAFVAKLRADTAQILSILRARQERERTRSGLYADGPEKDRGDLLPIAESLPSALLYRYKYRNDPACVAALIAEDTGVIPPALRNLCITEAGAVVILSDTPAR